MCLLRQKVVAVAEDVKVNVRKLAKEEHIRTRDLWEKVFVEDTPVFLDYYYRVKTAENEIYVIEDKGQIVSMIHLNPFQMRIGDQIYDTHYIVAVATEPQYRKQGLMRKLLNFVMQEMKERKEPFTFLMPAAEEIYKPFGFAFVYEQAKGMFSGKHKDNEVTFSFAGVEDCEAMADYANRKLIDYDIVTRRTDSYYQMILKEQESEQGGILLAKKGQEIVGMFCFAKETNFELREPLFDEEEIFHQAIYTLTGNETEEVRCVGYGNERKSMIMAKVLQTEFEGCFEGKKVFINEVV